MYEHIVRPLAKELLRKSDSTPLCVSLSLHPNMNIHDGHILYDSTPLLIMRPLYKEGHIIQADVFLCAYTYTCAYTGCFF